MLCIHADVVISLPAIHYVPGPCGVAVIMMKKYMLCRINVHNGEIMPALNSKNFSKCTCNELCNCMQLRQGFLGSQMPQNYV